MVFAVLDTLEDARATALGRLFAGVRVSAGGVARRVVRRGRLRGLAAAALIAYLRGLRLTGRVRTDGDVPRGTVRVRGLVRGSLEVGRGGSVTGRLGGRAVRSRPVRLVTTAQAEGRVPAAGPARRPSPGRAGRRLAGQGLHR